MFKSNKLLMTKGVVTQFHRIVSKGSAWFIGANCLGASCLVLVTAAAVQVRRSVLTREQG